MNLQGYKFYDQVVVDNISCIFPQSKKKKKQDVNTGIHNVNTLM